MNATCSTEFASSCIAAKPWEDKTRLLMSFEECQKNFFAPIAAWFLYHTKTHERYKNMLM